MAIVHFVARQPLGWEDKLEALQSQLAEQPAEYSGAALGGTPSTALKGVFPTLGGRSNTGGGR